MKAGKAYTGSFKGVLISDDFRNFIERLVIVSRMNEIAKAYNQSVIAYKVVKKQRLKKDIEAKLETLQKTYKWLEMKLNKLDEVAQ